jgi:hypothetical protein
MGTIWVEQWYRLIRRSSTIWSDAMVLFGTTVEIRFNREESNSEIEKG